VESHLQAASETAYPAHGFCRRDPKLAALLFRRDCLLSLISPVAGETAAQPAALYDHYKGQPNFGRIMQLLSVELCMEFARALNYVFYTGDNGTLTWTHKA
jgi:hypothetical protein